MSIEFKRLPDEPIVIATIIPPFAVESDAVVTLTQLTRYLAEIKGQLYYISDTTQLDQIGFSEIVLALSAVTKDPTSPLGDPRLKIYVVANLDLIKFGVDSAHQDQYGSLSMGLVDSIDEALLQIRAEIAGTS